MYNWTKVNNPKFDDYDLRVGSILHFWKSIKYKFFLQLKDIILFWICVLSIVIILRIRTAFNIKF